MIRNKNLSIEERREVVQALLNGKPISNVSTKFQCHRNTPRNLLKEIIKFGTLQNRGKTETSKIWNKARESFMLREIQKDPFISLRKLEYKMKNYFEKNTPSRSLIATKLKKLKLFKVSAISHPMLSEINRQKRLE